MATIYARETALKNVVGRSDYISNSKRQEEILLYKENMHYSWKDYVAFEKQHKKSKNENIQARETVIALPNELSTNKEQLEHFCDSLAQKMYGDNRDFEYAVHWNSARTNLHVHFIYSERERNRTREPKRYKRDIWADSQTGKTCKKDHPNAILRCKKGAIQTDKDGNLKYEDALFTTKDKKYNNKNWLVERNNLIQAVFSEFEHPIDLFDRETQLPQKKITKGCSHAFKEHALEYNQVVRERNQLVNTLTKAEPVIIKLEEKSSQLFYLHDEKYKLEKAEENRNVFSKFLDRESLNLTPLNEKITHVSKETTPLIQQAKTILNVEEAYKGQRRVTDIKILVDFLKKRVEEYKESLLTKENWIETHKKFTHFIEKHTKNKTKPLEEIASKREKITTTKQNVNEFSRDSVTKTERQIQFLKAQKRKRMSNRSSDIEL